MKKTIHVTQEIIDKANVSNSRGCLIYWAILPIVKEEYKESLEVGVSIFQVGGKTFGLNGLVADFITRAFQAKYADGVKVEPSTFEIEIPAKYCKPVKKTKENK